MEKIIFVLNISFVLFFASCECEVNTDFDFKHKSLINIYHKGDTICFSNDKNSLDTIVICEKKEWVNNCMLSSKSIEIKHLPKNNWIDSYNLTEKGLLPNNQSLLSIQKEIAPEGYDQFSEYSIYITYRNFSEKIEDSIIPIKSQLFDYLMIGEFFKIKNNNEKIDSLDILEIFWSNRYGLLGYKLKNNEIFKLKK
ncbi:MAG: hypothetical protein ACK476_15200 [Fluviicola sp.]